MPHITIEYSANVAEHHDIDALVGVVHDEIAATGVPTPGSLRTRAAEREHYRIADKAADYAFVAIMIRLAPGRTAETKARLMNAALDAGEALVDGQPSSLAIAWSAEIQEIDSNFRINRNHVRTRMQEATS